MTGRRAHIPRLVALLLAASVLPVVAATGAHAAGPITVNSTVDPGDGTCDVTQCTLHEAIAKANSDAGADEIDFAIPGAGVHAIALAGPLPAITGQLTIDGFTQGGPAITDHRVEVVGFPAIGGLDGLVVQAAGSVIEGLSVGDFTGNGIVVTADDVTVRGNEIGIKPDGTPYGNGASGVFIGEASGVVVGGTSSADRNVISSNDQHGIWITSDDNVVEGNFIGTDLDGTGDAGNADDGVFVEEAAGTTIGGTAAGARNVISANGTNDVFADGIMGVELAGSTVSDTLIQGNFIGTDVTGTLALGNHGNGVFTRGGAHDTTIGGTAAGAGNLLSGNDSGIVLFSPAGTVIRGNLIGTTVNGAAALPNRVGIGVEGPGVTIGGAAAGAGNVISGNTGRGIDLQSNNSVIQGNLIGTTADGLHALGNGTGLYVGGADRVLIGGSVPGAGNVVAASGADGIYVQGIRARIRGNFIGTDRSGTRSLGNGSNGVELATTLSQVGGSFASQGNLIKHNGAAGVVVTDAGDQDLVRHNLISANGGLAIDLEGDGVTPNDPGDGDTGANELQNFPVVRSAVRRTRTTVLDLRLHSAPDMRYAIDVYAVGSCDPSGHGEESRFLRTFSVTTDEAGSSSAVMGVMQVVPVGDAITVTATDVNGETSELSTCRTVTRG